MLKLVQIYKFAFIFFIVFFLSSCKNDENLKTPLMPTGGVSYMDPISYLNSIRMNSNLNLLSKNDTLSISSLNHAKYTYENRVDSHNEINSQPYFTGTTPKDRAFYAGYNSFISENLATNIGDEISSIDSLMSAIYHRFGFLDATIDEIGWGSYGDDENKNFVYNMGNSKFENFCKIGISDKGYGKFYNGICKNAEIGIAEAKFNDFQKLNRNSYVVYPNSTNTKAFFSKEIPDPMPECKITANPVSIEFNSPEDSISLVSFKIFEEDIELNNNKILTNLNDPNSVMNKNQFALFVKEPFKFNQKYKAVFRYMQKEKTKEISWEFVTSTPKNRYFVAQDGDSLALEPDIWYDIFIKPDNCNDVVNSYKTSYSPIQKPVTKSIDTNSLQVKISGLKGSKTTITTDNGKKINLILTKTSDSFKIYDSKIIFAFIFIIIFIIYFILKR